MIRDTASTIVVINGEATTAGSNLHFLASKGKVQPTILDITTVMKSESDTTAHLAAV